MAAAKRRKKKQLKLHLFRDGAIQSRSKKYIAFPFFLKLIIRSGHLRPSGTVCHTFEPENLKDVLPKLNWWILLV